MNAKEMKIGTRLELELINKSGGKIGQTYISQLMDVVNHDTIVIAAPVHESRLMLIVNGTNVRIIFRHDRHGILNFTGVISHKEKLDNLIVLYVKIESDFMKIQRRSYFRLDCNLKAAYQFILEEPPDDAGVNNQLSEYKKAITKNISGNGACIVTEDDIPKGSRLNLRIWLANDTIIDALCKVVRNIPIEIKRQTMFELGLFILEISQKDSESIVRYIFNQQRQLLKNNISDKI